MAALLLVKPNLASQQLAEAKNKSKASQADILEEGNEKLTNAFNNAEYFFEQYKNIILGVIIVIALAIGGWWAYNNFVKTPSERKAKDAIVYAQKYFHYSDYQCHALI